jgi:hypothetical protein
VLLELELLLEVELVLELALLLVAEAPPAPELLLEPEPQLCEEVAELRGATVPAVKSAELLSVSVQPEPARSAAVVLLSVAVGPLPS